jgi:tetraacyldisaccharide-1-P 4'-kinase
MLYQFAEQCIANGAEALLCTEKDGVKLSAEWKSPLPIIWMEAELRLVQGTEHWDALIEKMKALLR